MAQVEGAIVVLGAGQMGAGIAQVFAQNGYRTALYDVSHTQLEAAAGNIAANLAKSQEKGKLSPESRSEIGKRLIFTPDLSAVTDSALVIEAIVERLETKFQVWQQVAELASTQTIFASNTSSLPITQLAGAVNCAERFIGMHFMNPVPVMRLVEVIRGQLTSDQTHRTVMDTAIALRKTPVTVNDSPGFISNRILLPMINEAVFCIQEGLATREDIDTVMVLGMNHPMGPLALADFIGLDTCLAIMEVLHRDLGEDKYRPAPLLRKMVHAGLLGKKAGRGFYEYEKAPARAITI